MIDFFLSRPTDPVAYRDPSNGSAEKQADKHSNDSNEHCDRDDEDDILYVR